MVTLATAGGDVGDGDFFIEEINIMENNMMARRRAGGRRLGQSR